MKEGKRRIAREKRTVQTLIEMYCSGHHNRESACARSVRGYSPMQLSKLTDVRSIMRSQSVLIVLSIATQKENENKSRR